MTDWDQRQLCSDEACIGVIGADGTCKVCGRAAANWGDERKRGLVEDPEEAAETPAVDEGPIVTPLPAEGAGEWTDRKLCPDGACVGVIGDNGTCKVCGRSPEP